MFPKQGGIDCLIIDFAFVLRWLVFTNFESSSVDTRLYVPFDLVLLARAVNFNELFESIFVSKVRLRLCFNFAEKFSVTLVDEFVESPG